MWNPFMILMCFKNLEAVFGRNKLFWLLPICIFINTSIYLNIFIWKEKDFMVISNDIYLLLFFIKKIKKKLISSK